MRRSLFVLCAIAVGAAACGSSDFTAPDLLATVEAAATPAPAPTPTDGPESDEPGPGADAAAPPTVLRVQVVERRPHDPSAFTQGLEFHEGRLFESRGRYGTSGLSEIDPETGEVQRWVALDGESFGEGITVVDGRVILLTWRAETAYVFDLESFELVETFGYLGEGWGLCHDGRRLVMSNGSSELTFRDPQTFDVLGQVTVTYDGEEVGLLNELECVGDRVYANIWKQDVVVVIDPATGSIETLIDARNLLPPGEADDADVLNGIAYDDTTDSFLLTGKLWPAMFEVDLVE